MVWRFKTKLGNNLNQLQDITPLRLDLDTGSKVTSEMSKGRMSWLAVRK